MPQNLEYPFDHLGSTFPAASPPSSLCTPSLLAGGLGGVRDRKDFACPQALLSSNENITVFSAQIQNIIPYELMQEKQTAIQIKASTDKHVITLEFLTWEKIGSSSEAY